MINRLLAERLLLLGVDITKIFEAVEHQAIGIVRFCGGALA